MLEAIDVWHAVVRLVGVKQSCFAWVGDIELVVVLD
jgi:hypothetical protein